MAHRRYTVQLQDADGRSCGLRLEPFVILDFDTDQGARAADRQLTALLADLAHTYDPYPDERKPRTFRLAVHDAESGELLGHWTNV